MAREQTADKEEEIASLSRQLREVIQEAEVSERRAQTAETENERMAEIVDRMEERASTAEMEVKRLREEQSHAELERLRAMAAQQAKWEAREQRLEAQLAHAISCDRAPNTGSSQRNGAVPTDGSWSSGHSAADA